MRSCYLKTCVLLAVVAIAASCVQAATVTVTPENMRGWSIETNKGGLGALTKFGPCVYEHNGFVGEGGTPSFGTGAFYAENNYMGTSFQASDMTPSTVWLGTDQQNGQSLVGLTLNQIKTMNYYAYCAATPVRSDSVNWDSHTYWCGPNSQIMLQITAESPDGSDRKQFWLRSRSWGGGVQGPDGGMDAWKNGVWQYLDGISDRWYFAPNRDDLTDEAQWANWAALCLEYGNYKLVATSTEAPLKSAGWDNGTDPSGIHSSTATGKCLNFETGGRKAFAWLWFQGVQVSWFWDGVGFRGHLDRFTFGVDFNSDGDDYDTGEQVTYNFEPSATERAPTIKFANTKAYNENPLFDTQVIEFMGSTGMKYRSFGFSADEPETQLYMMHKVFGEVTARGSKFVALEDGSALNQMGDPPYYESLRAYFRLSDAATPAGTWIGSYWSGWGFVERLRGFNYASPPPLMLWTHPTHFRQFSE